MAKSGGARKYGRNLKKCERYRAEGRRSRNKLRKMKKRISHMNPKSQANILKKNPIRGS